MRITEGRIAAAEKLAKGSPAAGGSGPLSAAERAELVRLLGPRPDFDDDDRHRRRPVAA